MKDKMKGMMDKIVRFFKRPAGHALQAPMRLLTRMNVWGSWLLCDNKACEKHDVGAVKEVKKKKK